jgi:hypothetical protein
MLLGQEVVEYIKTKGDIVAEIYWDRNDKLSEEQLQKIMNASSIDEMNEIISDIEVEICDNNFEMADDAKDEFKKEVISKFDLDEDDDELMAELDDVFEDVNAYVSADLMDLIRREGDVHLTVAVAAKENPKYWEDDYLMLPGMYRDSISDSDENKQILSDVCAVLGIEKADMEAAYSKYHNLEEALVLPEPTNEVGVQQATAEKFIYDWENTTTDYGVLSFMTRISLDDYIKNFDRIHEDGIVIPAGAYCGLHDPMQGACSLMEIEVKTPIALKTNRIDISAGDADHNHGYSLESICGLTEEAWGKRGTYASLVRTDAEADLLSKMADLGGKNQWSVKGIKGFVMYAAESLSREINDGAIDARKGMGTDEIISFVNNYADGLYWYKDQVPDEIRGMVTAAAARAISSYAIGEIDKDAVYAIANTLTSEVNDFMVKRVASTATEGASLKDALASINKPSNPELK